MSKIEWTEKTWNPVTGCSKISPGCVNCYAERQTLRLQKMGLKKYAAGFDTVVCHPNVLDVPLHWKKPKTIFVCSMGDLFYEDVPFEYIKEVFMVMWKRPDHRFLLLTKRPERVLEFSEWSEFAAENSCLYSAWQKWIWLGVTAENQEQADKRIPILLQIPAAKRFVSIEPMLGPVYLNRIVQPTPGGAFFQTSVLHSFRQNEEELGLLPGWAGQSLDWVIVGGESGPGARPMHPDWVRSVRDQCTAASVPFFMKQLGEWAAVPTVGDDPDPKGRSAMAYPDGTVKIDWTPGPHNIGAIRMYRVGKKKAGRILDDRTWDQRPEVA